MAEFFCRKCFRGRRELIQRSNDQYIALSIVLPAGVMESYITIPFETTALMVSKEYDKVLRSSYGDDYMTPKKFDSNDFEHELMREHLDRS